MQEDYEVDYKFYREVRRLAGKWVNSDEGKRTIGGARECATRVYEDLRAARTNIPINLLYRPIDI